MPKILVTGTSAGGIGEYIVRSLLEDKSVEVIGVARRPADYGPRYTHVQGDLSSKETVAKIVAAVGSTLDGALFNAAVLGDITRVENIDVDMVKWVFEVNYFAVIALTKALIPALRASRGRAVFVSSVASEKGIQGWTAYGTSKVALNLFVEILALEEPDITALAIEPGVVDTPMQSSIREEQLRKGQMSKEDTETFGNLKKNGLLVDPKDSGRAFANLVLRAHKEWSGKYYPWNDPLFNSLTPYN